MKILIVSDTHGWNDNFVRVIEKEGTPDRVLHMGDTEGSEYYLSQVAGCPFDVVGGNNDFFSNLPATKLIEVEGYTIFMAHGHQYRVYGGTQWLAQAGRERGAHIVMYGHTHCPVIKEENGITLVNPGSLSYPRQEGRRPSYIIMEIDDNGKIEYELKYL